MCQKSQVFSLPLMFKNEIKYEDCIDIMDEYEEQLIQLFTSSHGTCKVKQPFHILHTALFVEYFATYFTSCVLLKKVTQNQFLPYMEHPHRHYYYCCPNVQRHVFPPIRQVTFMKCYSDWAIKNSILCPCYD